MVPVLKFKNTIEKVGKAERELNEMEKNGKRAANIPINHDEAMDMDEKEGNERWAEAEREEMNRLEFYGLLDGRYDYTEPQAFEWSYSKRSDGTHRARLMVEESEYAINRTILTPSMKSMSPIDDRTSIITSTAPILAIETQDCVPDHPYRSTFDRVIDSLRELVHEAERECKLIEKTFGYKVREEPLSFWFSNMDTIHDARLMTKTYRQELEELHDKPKSSTRTKLNLRRKFGMFVYDFMNYHLVLLPITYKESSTYTTYSPHTLMIHPELIEFMRVYGMTVDHIGEALVYGDRHRYKMTIGGKLHRVATIEHAAGMPVQSAEDRSKMQYFLGKEPTIEPEPSTEYETKMLKLRKWWDKHHANVTIMLGHNYTDVSILATVRRLLKYPQQRIYLIKVADVLKHHMPGSILTLPDGEYALAIKKAYTWRSRDWDTYDTSNQAQHKT